MALRALLVGSLVAGGLAANGCATRPPYATETSWPHKDVAEVRVFVSDALDADQYLAIAHEEADRLAATPREPPLFLVRFVFVESPPRASRASSRAETLAELELSTRGLSHSRGELVERSTPPRAAYFAIGREHESQ